MKHLLLLLLMLSTSTLGQTNLASGKLATASSNENASRTAPHAFDGNVKTRWASLSSDPQWIRVDLGSSQSISQIVLRWERAYSRHYRIDVSNDDKSWTTIYTTTNGKGGVETINATATARYVRAYLIGRATGWANSIWEFEVYGPTGTSPSSASASSVPSDITMKWKAPTQRENETNLDIEDIGGYEIRGFNAKNERKYTHTITNGRAVQHSVPATLVGGSTRFEIAAYDTDGSYSIFVPIKPVAEASNPNAPCSCD